MLHLPFDPLMIEKGKTNIGVCCSDYWSYYYLLVVWRYKALPQEMKYTFFTAKYTSKKNPSPIRAELTSVEINLDETLSMAFLPLAHGNQLSNILEFCWRWLAGRKATLACPLSEHPSSSSAVQQFQEAPSGLFLAKCAAYWWRRISRAAIVSGLSLFKGCWGNFLLKVKCSIFMW